MLESQIWVRMRNADARVDTGAWDRRASGANPIVTPSNRRAFQATNRWTRRHILLASATSPAGLLTRRAEWFHTSSPASKKSRGSAVSQFDPTKAVKVIRGVHEAGFEYLRPLFGR